MPADIAEEVARKVKRPVPSPVGYGVPQRIGEGASLHRYCPFFTTGERICYYPNGEGENCTSKKFKKKHGANPFMSVPESVEIDYTRDQLVSIVKSLEVEVEAYQNTGRGDSAGALEVSAELIDAYYELAEAEANETVAETVRAQARELENAVYALEDIPL